jgi:hypothetical protein
MVDYEVESTLREIRERVVAESSRASIAAPHSPDAAASAEASGGVVEASGIGAVRGGAGGEALARMQANLATTERAWSRLPPVMSYRRGAVARVELWLKRLIKRAAHWFTWEQVNFNSAAHNALSDAHAALAELRDALRRQQAEAESNAVRLSELHARLDAFESRLGNTEAHVNQALAQLASDMRQVVAEQRAGVEQLHADRREQLAALATGLREEARERVERALEEQRVCFKQLSLEASEAAVAQDRARRQIEARIEALEKTKAVTSDK